MNRKCSNLYPPQNESRIGQEGKTLTALAAEKHGSAATQYDSIGER